jgi:hypothetical protein
LDLLGEDKDYDKKKYKHKDKLLELVNSSELNQNNIRIVHYIKGFLSGIKRSLYVEVNNIDDDSNLYLSKYDNITIKQFKYQFYSQSISEILNLLERKRNFIRNLDTEFILDFDFDKLMYEKMRLVEIIKSGSLNFLGKDFTENISLIFFKDDRIIKEDIEYIWEYLMNEQNKLKKLF